MEKEHNKVMVNSEDELLRSSGFVVYDQTLQRSAGRGGHLGDREIQVV